ncbi:hypothetical protein HHK36_015083 [Tetracentron sinense]|uniref:BSD domain-containing protein n=1 Tax=Tetracentron sinense TaxID=13715 RepID=A0A834Z6J5_TETSI|nr:hypothetical protein HHK36_015083 [Tetracentron sinense]
MDLWQKARSFAEEAAKRSHEITKEAAKISQEITKEAAKRSQEFTIGSSKISDIVSETAKKSKEIAAEATKKADQIKIEALKRADQIKSLAEGISPQIPAAALSLVDSSSATSSSSDLEKFGVTDDLREFVKEIKLSTFQDFPMEDEPQMSDVPTVSNVRQDLTEWQAKHATFVLSTVKVVPFFLHEAKLANTMIPGLGIKCGTIMIEFKYEKQYMEEVQLKSAEQAKELKETPTIGATSKTELTETNRQSKTSTTSSAEQDLDIFLLGDLGDSDEGPDGDDGGFDDDFDKIEDNSEDEDKMQL